MSNIINYKGKRYVYRLSKSKAKLFYTIIGGKVKRVKKPRGLRVGKYKPIAGGSIKDILKKLNPLELVKKGLSGSVSTKLKTLQNRRGGFPPAFKGELHPMSLAYSKKTGKRGLYWDSYLGPNTNVAERLRQGIKPLPGPNGEWDSADRCGFYHDIRFGLAPKDPKKGVPWLQEADRKFISKLLELRKRLPNEKLNPANYIGVEGIKLKNKLEKSGKMSKTRYLNPFDPVKEADAIKIAKKKLAIGEKYGYGRRRKYKRRRKIKRIK